MPPFLPQKIRLHLSALLGRTGRVDGLRCQKKKTHLSLLCDHFPVTLFALEFVCLFVVIKPENPYFASVSGVEVKPLGEYPFGPRSSSCGPTKDTPPPRNTLRAN